MRRIGGILLVWLTLPATVLACLWDRDTPRDEARGLPEVVSVIAGRFPRNPPLFYEMRLKRVAAEVEGKPDDLALYDDAGVSCDRLRRGDEAIGWMDRKRERLDRLGWSDPAVRDHWYRYHANLGTFLVHRWLRAGADRAKLDEVRTARDHIARALEINPDAHFGRETYQLEVLRWIVDPPEPTQYQPELPSFLGWSLLNGSSGSVPPTDADRAVRGLAGLIVLGDAWESVDVYYALELALHHDSVGFANGDQGGRNSLAILAYLRCRELIDAGRGSLWPPAPKGEELKRMILAPEFVDRDNLLVNEYRALRTEADAWQAHRLAFLNARLAQGRHPDTDPKFWDGYTEAAPPRLPDESPVDAHHRKMRDKQRQAIALVIGGIGASLLVAVLIIRSARRQNRADQRLAKPVRLSGEDLADPV